MKLDSAVGFSIASRAASISTSAITTLIVLAFLSPYEQGYFYTFSSIAALHVFAELGLTIAIMNFASHEFASLNWDDRKQFMLGKAESISRLSFLLVFGLKWFGAGAGLCAVLLVCAGMFFFGYGSASATEWLWAWVGLSIFVSMNLLLMPFFSILDGCGRVKDVAIVRLSQTSIAAAGCWVALYFGAGLASLAILSAITFFVGAALLFIFHGRFFAQLFAAKHNEDKINWVEDILPFQWRIAISWICGYCIFQLFNPLVFKFHGPEAAGRIGVTLSVVGSLTSLAASFISTRAPEMGRQLALGNRPLVQTMVKKSVMAACLTFLGLASVFLALLSVWPVLTQQLTQRFSSVWVVLFLVFAATSNIVSTGLATALRANREEPLLPVSIANAVALAALLLFLVPKYGEFGAAIAYAACQTGIGALGAYVVYRTRFPQS